MSTNQAPVVCANSVGTANASGKHHGALMLFAYRAGVV
jgi:hypothetical protein